jgi:hypothetical protein
VEALRQYTSTLDGNLILKVPKGYRKRKLEIIIMPAEESSNKRQEMATIMDKMSDRAQKNGLTQKILDEILN